VAVALPGVGTQPVAKRLKTKWTSLDCGSDSDPVRSGCRTGAVRKRMERKFASPTRPYWENHVKITLKIVGDELFSSLSKEVGLLNLAFPKMSQQNDHIEWQVTHLSTNLKPENLLSYPESASVLLIDAQEPSFIDKIERMKKTEMSFIKDPPFLPIVLSPVVLVFRSHALLAETPDFPEFVSDWICMPYAMPDLVRRVVSSLKRKNILKTKLRFGSLTLLPESRVISYQGKTIHLTPSEFALAELFLNQMGTVIPIKDLVLLFKSTGKSTEGSNIRVTIFQLRLKLEMLTKSHFTLASVYKQGYCLKQKIKPTLDNGSFFDDGIRQNHFQSAMAHPG
jgi:DNA-binding winged helix-turn-helix (wHTH) protein